MNLLTPMAAKRYKMPGRNIYTTRDSETAFLRVYRRFLPAFLLMALGLVGGCGIRPEEMESKANSGKPSQVIAEFPQGGKGFRVGVSLRQRNDALDRAMQGAIETTGKARNLTLDIESAGLNRERQLEQVEALLGKGVNAILLCPADTVVADTAVREANNAHIPIFTADIPATRGAVVSHIAVTKTAGGKASISTLEEPDRGARIGKIAVETVAAYLRGEKVKSLTAIPFGQTNRKSPKDVEHKLPR